MEDMPRPPKPYLHHYLTRHGKYIWYVRKPGEKRIRIRGVYGSPEFNAAYEVAIAGNAALAKVKPASGTVHWLWARYHEVGAWKRLSKATKRQRHNIMRHVLEDIGTHEAGTILKADIVASRDKRADTPSQARNFLDCMRGLFEWAAEAGHVADDPTAGVKNPEKVAGEGFPMWDEEEIDRFYEKWPLGTRQRVWIDVLLYTGLRRGDGVRIGPRHVRNGIITTHTEKSQGEVVVTIPILPVLQVTLNAGPTGESTFIAGESGRPLTKESFGNMFRAACRDAKIDKSAHGLRKVGATRAAENGATVAELEAIFGWRGGGMASLYTLKADRARISKGAITKLQRPKDPEPMCQPAIPVGTTSEKDKQ